MKNFHLLTLLSLVAAILLSQAQAAHAILPFKKEFDAKYLKAEPSTPEEEALAAGVAKAKCNVCHVGIKKKDKNAYGIALGTLLDKKADAKDTAKIQDALDQVAAMKSNPDDPDSPTFGDLIKAGKLPGGEVEGDAEAEE